MKKIINYYLTYYPEFINSYTKKEFNKLFITCVDRINKLSDLPKLINTDYKFFKKYNVKNTIILYKSLE